MKTITIIIITLAVALPLIGVAATGLIQGSSLSLKGSYGEVRKVIDTEENIICYVYDSNKSSGISCLQDVSV